MVVKSSEFKENDEYALVLDMCSNEEVLKKYFFYYKKDLIENTDMDESYKSGIKDLPDLLKLFYDLGKNGEVVRFEKSSF